MAWQTRLKPKGFSLWCSQDHVITDARYLIMNHLDIEAAVNDPALIHAELALLCDIVLASETAVFQDRPHFPSGLGDGDRPALGISAAARGQLRALGIRARIR